MEGPTMNETSSHPAAQPRETSVSYLRDMAAARVEHTSLRGTAREIGMSPTGLKKFLLGTTPYSPTVRRLRRWYLQHAALPTGEVGVHDASAALQVLTHDLPPQARRAATECLLDCLAQGYEAIGRSRPRWIADLRVELAGG
jgi:hypothetical protein